MAILRARVSSRRRPSRLRHRADWERYQTRRRALSDVLMILARHESPTRVGECRKSARGLVRPCPFCDARRSIEDGCLDVLDTRKYPWYVWERFQGGGLALTVGGSCSGLRRTARETFDGYLVPLRWPRAATSTHRASANPGGGQIAHPIVSRPILVLRSWFLPAPDRERAPGAFCRRPAPPPGPSP